ncbi:MAG: hypothetical protein WAW27_07985, partial [Chitinophagaceae bacterium]
ISLKMFVSGATVAAATKDANLINKIAILQNCIFTMCCKYTLTILKLPLNEIPADTAHLPFFICQ